MAIIHKKKVTAAPAPESTSTHFSNGTTSPAVEDGAAAINHQTLNDLLVDPDDTSGSTHFSNNTTFSEKTNRNNGSGSVKASRKKSASILADFMEDSLSGEDEFDSDDTLTDVNADSGISRPDNVTPPGSTQTIQNGKGDPADGYLTIADSDFDDDDNYDNEFEGETDEVDASELEEDETDEVDASEIDPAAIDNGGANQQHLMVESDADWDDTDSVEDIDSDVDDSDVTPQSIEDGSFEDEEEPDEVVSSPDEQMSLLDIDETDDTGDDVVFASIGTRLHVIKANRIIASLGKKYAIQAGHEDVYLGDEFQDVVGIEMAKHGLRAGLQKMGFQLATVNISKNEVINKRVEAKSKVVTAALRRTTDTKHKAMSQCLAIAAVGINRAYFKDTRNELRAALQEELESAGMRNASAMLKRIFASHGVSYAKSILTLASKLSDLPENARNQFVAALDMTSDGSEDSDFYGEETSPDFQTEYANVEDESADEEFDDAFEDELGEPTSIMSSLSQPARRRKEISAKSTGYSVSASAVLSGDAPFPVCY